MAERPRGKSNAPLIIIFVLVGLVLLAGLAYAAMVAMGPMPGMGH
ncbi:MAG TPA: hypothetical protein VM070_00320 [Candidatus Saccharimonadales bacterium]|nr:hypothetical protein [Candidatus Saccharimonadales bacterium]